MRTAILSTFVPITPEPLQYNLHILPNMEILPKNPAKLVSTSLLTVRFSDFTLDGGMFTSYFYCVKTINSKMKILDNAQVHILGPIQLINTQPPEAPIIRKVKSRLPNPVTNTTAAVIFDIGTFASYDNITQISIYRSSSRTQALSVRLMKKVKTIQLTSQLGNTILELIDDFAGESEIPFEELYYRLVAERKVEYKDSIGTAITEFVPSLPSIIVKAKVVDTINPEPPTITANYNLVNDYLENLVLSWNKTTYNGRYILFKMNSGGNWSKIHEIYSNNHSELNYSFADPVSKVDEDGDTIYHRFKVTVEGTSGLLNVREEVLTL